MQQITRSGSFDAAHRIMNERVKCFNVHGHTFNYELTFAFAKAEDLGYALDFKEIKRVACSFIDEYLDHAAILNPSDVEFISLVERLGSRHWVMSLAGGAYCNPSAENISKELFLAVSRLIDTDNIRLVAVRLHETAKCWVDTKAEDISEKEKQLFLGSRASLLDSWKTAAGSFEYDDRKA